MVESPRNRVAVLRVEDPLLTDRVADTQYRPAYNLAAKSFGVNDSADISDRKKIGDVVLPGFQIHFYFGETRNIGEGLTVMRIFVFRRGDQALTGQCRNGCLCVFIHIIGRFMAVVDAAQLDGALRGLSKGHAFASTLVKDAFVGYFILLRLAAVCFCRNFLQLLFAVHRDSMRSAGHRMRSLAAAGDASPWQVLAGVTPFDIALFPGNAQDLGDHPMHVTDGFRPKVADSRLDCDPAIGSDDEQPVVSGRAREEAARRYADSAHLCAAPLRTRDPFLPFKLSEPRSSASLRNALVE